MRSREPVFANHVCSIRTRYAQQRARFASSVSARDLGTFHRIYYSSSRTAFPSPDFFGSTRRFQNHVDPIRPDLTLPTARLGFPASHASFAFFGGVASCRSTSSVFSGKMTAVTGEHKLCMIPGPVEIHEDVLAAASTPALSHVAPSFVEKFGKALELVRQVVLTKTGQPFIIAGSGTLGWDMTAANLVEPGEDVLVLNSGYFGDRFGECLATYGAKVDHVRAPIGDRPSLEQVRKALKAKQYKLLAITHVDTSTSVLQNVKEICAVAQEVSKATLIAVDGVCSVASEELRMDEWGVDVVMTASQKALGCPPGLCVLVASERAIETFKSRKSPVANYYAGWARWLPIMKNYEARKPSYFATPSVQLVCALLVSLQQIVAQDMELRFAAHVAASNRVKDAFERWGLKMLPVSREKASNSLTAVYYGDNVVGTDLLPKIASHGAIVAGGLHVDCAAKYFRVGHMGISVTEPDRRHIDKTLYAIEKALKDCGYIRK